MTGWHPAAILRRMVDRQKTLRDALQDFHRHRAGDLSAREWMDRWAVPLMERLAEVEGKVSHAAALVDRSSTLAIGAARGMEGIRRSVETFRQTTGDRRDRPVGNSAARWRHSQRLAREIEDALAGFLRASAESLAPKPVDPKPALGDPKRRRADAAQRLADLVAAVRKTGAEGPAFEGFERTVAKIRRGLLRGEAVEDVDPADGGQEN